MNENQDKVWYSRGITLNKGNFESERIDVGIALVVPQSAPGSTTQEAALARCWLDARDFVESRLSELVAEATGAEPEPRASKRKSSKKASKKKRRPPPDDLDDQDQLRREAARERTIQRVSLRYVDDFESDHGPRLEPEDLDNDMDLRDGRVRLKTNDALSEQRERVKQRVVKRAINNQRWRGDAGPPKYDLRDALSPEELYDDLRDGKD